MSATRWGLLTAAARNSGIVVPIIDGLLAATALEHNLKLVTRDTDRFHRWAYKGAQYYNQL